ncbi:hypothetical protein WBO78_27435 [Bosea sp. CCNWLW174]|uniref:hypothetical protein n=1 Tax=unclassified Bosea (in: a-proteobacteria) TaxID=2653178 RepID=UPI0030142BDC
MLRPFLIAAAVASTAAFSDPAQAQVEFRFGIDQPGYDGPRYHEPRGTALPENGVASEALSSTTMTIVASS